jgi:hypothetical protein
MLIVISSHGVQYASVFEKNHKNKKNSNVIFYNSSSLLSSPIYVHLRTCVVVKSVIYFLGQGVKDLYSLSCC